MSTVFSISETCNYPDCLKTARIIPIHKKGDRNDLNNYRPISILPVFSKIFEKGLHTQLYSYFEKNNLFSNFQYGFRKKRSTKNALLKLVAVFNNCFENREFGIASFLDLSKAFDCVPHGILLNKIRKYNISDNSCNLMASFLDNRYQIVSLGNINSKCLKVHHGVPQGSVLGPLLLLIYINNFTFCR